MNDRRAFETQSGKLRRSRGYLRGIIIGVLAVVVLGVMWFLPWPVGVAALVSAVSLLAAR